MDTKSLKPRLVVAEPEPGYSLRCVRQQEGLYVRVDDVVSWLNLRPVKVEAIPELGRIIDELRDAIRAAP